VVEKILEDEERMPSAWAVHGTTGYDFLNRANGLFVDVRNARPMEEIAARFVGETVLWRELVHEKKRQVMADSLASEITFLPVPFDPPSTAYVDVFTGDRHEVRAVGGRAGFSLGKLFTGFPVVMLSTPVRGEPEDAAHDSGAAPLRGSETATPTGSHLATSAVSWLLLQPGGLHDVSGRTGRGDSVSPTRS
jgi:hypothetical protein